VRLPFLPLASLTLRDVLTPPPRAVLSLDRLITALNALKSKASIHTITAGNRHSTARWVCDREEAGKVAVTLRDLVDSASK
jgi:hypothetical protein